MVDFSFHEMEFHGQRKYIMWNFHGRIPLAMVSPWHSMEYHADTMVNGIPRKSTIWFPWNTMGISWPMEIHHVVSMEYYGDNCVCHGIPMGYSMTAPWPTETHHVVSIIPWPS